MVVPDIGPILGVDFVTLLRVATMLVFIAVFLGIAVWLLTPHGRRRTSDQAMDILRDDDPHSPGQSIGQPPGRTKESR